MKKMVIDNEFIYSNNVINIGRIRSCQSVRFGKIIKK